MVVVVVLATLALVTARKAKLPNFVFMHDESTDGRFVREQPHRRTRTRTHRHAFRAHSVEMDGVCRSVFTRELRVSVLVAGRDLVCVGSQKNTHGTLLPSA
jgi:hypothetical protein